MSLTSRIQALIAYANEVTSESDTTLADAVATLADGYGGGGGSGLVKKTGTFLVESNYSYTTAVSSAYSGSILINTGLSDIKMIAIWSDKWADQTADANCFGATFFYDSDMPFSSNANYPGYYGFSYSKYLSGTNFFYGDDQSGPVLNKMTSTVSKGYFGIKTRTNVPIIAGHTIHWEAYGTE